MSIDGYRELSPEETAFVNKVKALGPQVQALFEEAKGLAADPRWLAIAQTEWQKGAMELIRAVTRPTGFF